MRIAVVGAGIAGLTSAYLLHKHHDVHLFEKEAWMGGHTHTLGVNEGSETLSIDTGFIVFNDHTYPLFNALLSILNIPKQKTTMSFSVSNQFNGLEYNGTNITGLFAQRRNILNRKFIGMLKQIMALNDLAKKLSVNGSHLTLDAFIQTYKIKPYTVENYLLPMCCAIWSCKREQILATPVQFLFDFLNNHGMLNINDRPQWYVVQGGSHTYVKALLKAGSNIKRHQQEPVNKVYRTKDCVQLETNKTKYTFDKVVMATHANDTLALLGDPTVEEKRLLSCFPYQDNAVVLHTDASVLPRNKRAWACWNYRIDNQSKNHCRLSYNMNLLQGLSSKKTYCVSINQTDLIDKNKIIATFTYAHPIYTQAGFNAQKQQLTISGKQAIFYCGAYWGYGFHEDGVRSALHIAKSIGGLTL